MKRIFLIFLSALMCFLLISCSRNNETAPTSGSDKVDVDLTVLSSTMVYAEVYDMLMRI